MSAANERLPAGDGAGRDGARLRAACAAELARRPALPLPGGGATLSRWRALAEVGARDLAEAKLIEAHHDARAILAEIGGEIGGETGADGRDAALWTVWAAEPPDAVLHARAAGSSGRVRLQGTKAWCSGARLVDRALVTALGDDGGGRLVAVALAQPGVTIDERGWGAVGMARVATSRVTFDDVQAQVVGEPGAYLARAGFWHGGAGVAACWWGAAAALGRTLRRAPEMGRRPHALAKLGRVDTVLAQSAALLRELAAAIDAEPARPRVREVIRVRGAVERAASETIEAVGRALGAAPLCLDAEHAQRAADLATFVRQHHAERDDEAQARALLEEDGAGAAQEWRL